jgi:hypothetical protein
MPLDEPEPPSVSVTMLPAAFFVKILPSAQLISSSDCAASLVVGTAPDVNERLGFMVFAMS